MNTRAISKNGKKSLAAFLVLLADRKLTMALIKCSECGKDVSDKATACPNCGAPARSGRARQRRDNTPVRVVRAGWRWEVIGALFVIGGLIAAIAGASSGWLVLIVGPPLKQHRFGTASTLLKRSYIARRIP